MKRGEQITVQEAESRNIQLAQRATLTWSLRARRIQWEKPILCRECGASEWHPGTTKNLSESGVLFATDHSLFEDTDVEMVFEMPKEISGKANGRMLYRGYVAQIEYSPKSSQLLLAVAVSADSFLPEN